jgi:amino acid transporter
MLAMRSRIISFTVLLMVLALSLFGSAALAVDCASCSTASNLSTAGAVECGSDCASGGSQTPATASKNIGDTITSVITILSIFVAAISIVMIMLGGFRYVTSSGSQEAVAGAKRTITYALIGIVVAALAQVLVHFVLAKTQNTIK